MKIQSELDIFHEKQDLITEQVTESGNDPLYLDGWEGGLIGFDIDDKGFVHAVYSEENMIDYYCRQNNCSYEDAYEFYSYNTIRALPYCDEKNRPIIIHTC